MALYGPLADFSHYTRGVLGRHRVLKRNESSIHIATVSRKEPLRAKLSPSRRQDIKRLPSLLLYLNLSLNSTLRPRRGHGKTRRRTLDKQEEVHRRTNFPRVYYSY